MTSKVRIYSISRISKVNEKVMDQVLTSLNKVATHVWTTFIFF